MMKQGVITVYMFLFLLSASASKFTLRSLPNEKYIQMNEDRISISFYPENTGNAEYELAFFGNIMTIYSEVTSLFPKLSYKDIHRSFFAGTEILLVTTGNYPFSKKIGENKYISETEYFVLREGKYCKLQHQSFTHEIVEYLLMMTLAKDSKKLHSTDINYTTRWFFDGLTELISTRIAGLMNNAEWPGFDDPYEYYFEGVINNYEKIDLHKFSYNDPSVIDKINELIEKGMSPPEAIEKCDTMMTDIGREYYDAVCLAMYYLLYPDIETNVKKLIAEMSKDKYDFEHFSNKTIFKIMKKFFKKDAKVIYDNFPDFWRNNKMFFNKMIEERKND